MRYFKRRNEAIASIASSVHDILVRFDKFFDDIDDIRLALQNIDAALTKKLKEEAKGGIASRDTATFFHKPCVCGHAKLYHNLLGNCQECNCEVYHLMEVIE